MKREDWEQVRLGDVCKLINGRAYKKEEMLSEGKYLLLRVGNFFSNRSWYYSDLELDESKYCDDGDLLYAWSASFGPRIWQGGKVIYHYHIWKTDFDSRRVLKRFLYHWFEWDTESIKAEQGAGTTMIHVTKGAMEKRTLYLPSLSEQKRIVAILDEVFAGIDDAIANTEKNLTNARELFESCLNTTFSQENSSWKHKKLKEITSKIGSGATPRGGKNAYQTEGIPLIRSLNVHDRRFKKKNLAFLNDEQAQKLENVIVEKNDVLLNITGASIARSCIAPSEYLPARVNQHVTIIRIESDEISCHFLSYLLTSKPYKEKLLFTGDQAGATRQALTKSQIQDFLIFFPAVSEQKIIVEKLASIESQVISLEAIYQQKLTALNELKQSILQKAFTGELTADTASQAKKAKEEIAA